MSTVRAKIEMNLDNPLNRFPGYLDVLCHLSNRTTCVAGDAASDGADLLRSTSRTGTACMGMVLDSADLLVTFNCFGDRRTSDVEQFGDAYIGMTIAVQVQNGTTLAISGHHYPHS